MGKFYWLKLKKDFFKRHDIRIIEGKKDGDRMVLFYLKLLCESVDHDGSLRFSDEVPYDNDMLASVTNTEKELVDEAMQILKKLGMIKTKNDGTIIMCGVDSMLGSDTTWAEKKRQYRDKLRTEAGQTEDNSRTNRGQTEDTKEDMSDKSKSIEKEYRERDKSIEKDIKDISEREKEKEREKGEILSPALSGSPKKRFVPPTVEEVRAYCIERKNTVDPEAFVNFYSSKNWYVGKTKMVDWKASVRLWESRRKDEPKQARKPSEIPIMEKEFSAEEQKAKEDDMAWLFDD